jgi:beta-lactamase superfamily II metal-dependent hydrolase
VAAAPIEGYNLPERRLSMPAQHLINIDLAKVYEKADKKGFLTLLGCGDEVEVVDIAEKHVEIKVIKFVEQPDHSIKPEPVSGFIVPSAPMKPADIVVEKAQSRILKVDFVDVQQGDGAVIESPSGRIVLIDGGDNQLFARYLANRFRGTKPDQFKEIDCILVTHGDADHFLGLTEIFKSETDPHLANSPWKRLFIHPQRVYHNGLVKRPTTLNGHAVKETELLGATQTVTDPTTHKDVMIITGLEENLLQVPREQMNQPFQKWQDALKTFDTRGAITFRRLKIGDNDAFEFLAGDGIKVEVFGPIPIKIGSVEGLKFLGNPPKGPRIGQESLHTGAVGFSGHSASHTINGHSIVFRLRYGSFNLLFTGDLNDEAGQTLTRAHNRGEISVQAEVFKVPHHGSADFSGAFIQAVAPVVSVVSSGDESARKEFIHPRATLMGALGRYGRLEEPLIFVTELVAFFEVEGFVDPERHQMKDGHAVIKDGAAVELTHVKRPFFAFSRAAFGLVMVRTDGDRLLVYTNSAQADLKEAYAHRFNNMGRPEPALVRQA